MSGTGGVSHRKASTAVLAPLHRNIIPISSTIQTIFPPPQDPHNRPIRGPNFALHRHVTTAAAVTAASSTVPDAALNTASQSITSVTRRGKMADKPAFLHLLPFSSFIVKLSHVHLLLPALGALSFLGKKRQNV